MTPRLTIAIPFVDEAPVLDDAIRSVFAQTFTDWELLLVDDGSTDGSLEIARSVRDPRVRVVSDGMRRRLPTRLNQVVREARGELVARMDADDLMHPTRLAREIALLDSDPGLSAVGTFVGYSFADGSPPLVGEIPLAVVGRDALTFGGLAHASMVSRKSFSASMPYDESLDRAEDRDLYCRAFGVARFGVVPEPLYVIRPRTASPSFVNGYVRSMQQNRVLYMRHGPRLAGLAFTARALVGSLAREAVYRVAAPAGLVDRLVKRRGRTATPYEARLVEEAIEAVRTTSVPGLTARVSAPPNEPR